MTINPKFWQNKRVFITGHTGFKGSWLSLWLEFLGADILGYALPPITQPNLFELIGLDKTVNSVLGDIRDFPNLVQVIKDYQPDIIIHLAAQSLVRQSYLNPVETYEINVMGTVNLLEAIRQTSCIRAVVNVTSDKCYENKEWVWGYREQDRIGGSDPYSNSKSCSELVTMSYRNSFFHPANYQHHHLAIATGRAGNVIGGGDWSKDRLIPDVIMAWLQGKEVLIRNPEAVRPWQYVLEPLNGYLLLAEKLFNEGPAYNGGWNFGPHSSGIQSVSWILENLKRAWEEQVSWTHDQNHHPHEANILKLDCSKAISHLGWQPQLELETTIRWIVEWVKAWQKGADMRKISQAQIQKFMEISDL